MAITPDPQLMPRFGFTAGTEIFKEGDIGDVAYVVQDGEVEISRMVNGQRKVLGVIRNGGIFGEMALIDGKPRMASATAVKETACLIIRREIMERKLEAADPFIKRLLQIFVRNIRSMADG
jgi:CRP/FNR family transcriptional regulator, cyclic AMP receptor protein